MKVCCLPVYMIDVYIPTVCEHVYGSLYGTLSYSEAGNVGRKFSDGIVWVDIETTGLDPDADRMLQIAVVVTDASMDAVIKVSIYVNMSD
mgnify:CR=1 FL=1